MLEVWSLTEEAPAVGCSSARRPAAARPGIAAVAAAGRVAPRELRALEVDGGAALFRVTNGRVSVLQLEAADEEAAATLLAAARARGTSLHYVNVPEGDAASAALARLGGTLDLRQFELRLTRAPVSE